MTIHTFRFNVNAGGEQSSLTNHELLEYAKQIRLHDVAEGRYAWLFALEVMMTEKQYGIDSFQIVAEIKAMEEGKTGFHTKAPSLLTRERLRGLWHKHYFAPRFLPQNILSELPKKKMLRLAEEVFDWRKWDVVTEEMVNEFSHRVAIESFEERGGDKRLTGEWIVFAKHNGKNYYLCLSTHTAGDETVAQQIRDVCCPQFPFICENYPRIAQQECREGRS